jgi:hypothetical protein
MRFGAWKVISLYRAGLLTAVASNIQIRFSGCAGVSLDKGGTVRAGDYIIKKKKRNENH